MALNLVGSYLTDDVKFLTNATFDIIIRITDIIGSIPKCKINANDEYASKVKSVSTEKILYSLGLKVDELTLLIQAGRRLFVEIKSLQEID